MQRHNGFAPPVGRRRDLKQLSRILNGLNHHSDDFDVRIVDKIFDVILDGGAESISARNNVIEPHLAIGHQRREDVVGDTAALRQSVNGPVGSGRWNCPL